jgi:hypothetical protein
MARTRGDNVSRFRDAQLEFAAHIRDPDHQPAPADIEPRRMRVYVDLFYKNIERFVATAFPVTRRILDDASWHDLVRGFLRDHRATSPYFQEIAQEFLEYLSRRADVLTVHPFLLELTHYEWVELALDVSTDELPSDIDRAGDLLAAIPVVSPLVWPLVYRFPVHRIGPDFHPTQAAPSPTHLIVYRNRADQVKFMESTPVAARLLSLLIEHPRTGRAAITTLAGELNRSADDLTEAGTRALEELRACDIIAGTRMPA